MILVIKNSLEYTDSFIEYIKQKNINHQIISLQEIIQYGVIHDSTYVHHILNCKWVLRESTIDFLHIEGVYNTWNWLDINHFNDYCEEDREFIMSEWNAYLCFRLNNLKHCVNPPINEKNCGLIQYLPFSLDLAEMHNLKTPRYHFTTERNKASILQDNNEYILLKDLNQINNYSKTESLDKDYIGMIEYIEGSMIIAYVIGDSVLSWVESSNKFTPTNLPSGIIDSLKAINSFLKISLSEVRLIKDSYDNYFFFFFSIFPNWGEYNLQGIEVAYDGLIEILKKNL